MKKLLTLFLALTCAVGIFAHDCVIDGIYYKLDRKSRTASVTYKGTKSDKNTDRYVGAITIPPSIVVKEQTYSVTSIGEEAFRRCYGLTSITIPNSVTSIGSSAFSSCHGLTSITIPNSVTVIRSEAFSGCRGLTSITIPNSVTSIGSSAFSSCSNLTSITIPNSVTSIEDWAFAWCQGLTSITIPNSVTSIEDWAFYNCSSLTSITIPNSVTTIGYEAFQYCSGLTSVTIPNSVTSIGGSAFYNCNKLKSIYDDSGLLVKRESKYGIPSSCNIYEGVVKGDYVLKNSTIIKYLGKEASVIIPDSITTIGSSAFSSCSSLTSITIPNSVTTIGSSAFWGCSSLTSITIPYSVTTIGGWTFSHCSRLTSVMMFNPNVKIDSWAFDNCNITDLYCGESVDLSKADGTIKNVHRLNEEELQYYLPFDQYAKGFVESQINEWQIRGKYEKTADWQARVNETTRKKKIEEFYKEAQEKYMSAYTKRQSYHFTLDTYDPDNEVFLVKEDQWGDLLVSVPIANAEYVETNWSSCTSTPHYAFSGTDIVLQSVDFTFPNKKTYIYKLDQKLTYSTADLNYNFEPIELPEMQTVTVGGGDEAQSQVSQGITDVVITTPFDLTPMSSVLVSYKNIFGKYEMPDLDVTFPYVVVRVKLTGASNIIRLAKQSLSLDLGQSYIVEQTVPQDDKILFLIPNGVRNIYLTDGNGHRQLLYSGRLQPNTIYDGTVEVK